MARFIVYTNKPKPEPPTMTSQTQIAKLPGGKELLEQLANATTTKEIQEILDKIKQLLDQQEHQP